MNIRVIILLLATASLLKVGWCQNSCPIVTAPDGSTYDLSYISDRVYQVSQTAGGQVYTYNISICAPIASSCAGACSSPNSAGVCQFWGPAPANAKCYGSYNTAQVVGLNYGLGVQITYSGGDVCGSCNPSGPRASLITLKCKFDGSDPTKIDWTSGPVGGEPQLPPIIYFNGTFNCKTSDFPKPHIITRFYRYVSDSGTCNKTDAYMVTVNRTVQCSPGCSLVSDSYVYTECDRILELPSGTWVEQINYSSNTTCDTVDSAVYTKADQCAGYFEFSRLTCDADTIYSYLCNSPYCKSCRLLSKTQTETCVNGTKYVCASDNKKRNNLYIDN